MFDLDPTGKRRARMGRAATLITIITCPRRGGVVYLRDTAAALLREGASGCDARLILGDAASPVAEPGWESLHRPRFCGVRGMLWWAFRIAWESGYERLIFCEDDVTPCRNAIARVLCTEVPASAAFVDFHDMKELRGRATNAGLFAVPSMGLNGQGYWGNQCMLFPRRTIGWLLQRDPMSVPRGNPPQGADIALGWLLSRSPWPTYAVHLPRLVRHVGAVSSAHPGSTLDAERATPDYLGDDFDALTLETPTLVELAAALPAAPRKRARHRARL